MTTEIEMSSNNIIFLEHSSLVETLAIGLGYGGLGFFLLIFSSNPCFDWLEIVGVILMLLGLSGTILFMTGERKTTISIDDGSVLYQERLLLVWKTTKTVTRSQIRRVTTLEELEMNLNRKGNAEFRLYTEIQLGWTPKGRKKFFLVLFRCKEGEFVSGERPEFWGNYLINQFNT